MCRKLSLIVILTLIAFAAFAQYDYEYDSEALDDVWSANDKIKIEGTCWVVGTLNIPAGVKIYFGTGAKIQVGPGETLTASGTSTNRIKFKGISSTPGYWDYIQFDGNMGNLAWGDFDHCVFEYGGRYNSAETSAGGIIYIIDHSDIELNNCEFRHNEGYALACLSGGASANYIDVEDCVIWDHECGLKLDNLFNLAGGNTHDIKNNIIIGLDEINPSSGYHGYGIWLGDGCSDHVIENNIIAECAGTGIVADKIYEINFNTIAHIGGSGIYLEAWGDVLTGYSIKNNIIYDYDDYGVGKGANSDAFTVSYNYVYDPTGTEFGVGITDNNTIPAGLDTYPPGFTIDSWNGNNMDVNDIDYHLAFNSPCVHSGDTGEGYNPGHTDTDRGAYGGPGADPYYLVITGAFGTETLDVDMGPFKLYQPDVSPTGTFTIADEVSIECMQDAHMTVSGTLDFDGDGTNNRISFEPPAGVDAKGWWTGITGSSTAEFYLDYVTIKYADYGVTVNGSGANEAQFNDVEIYNCKFDGIKVIDADLDFDTGKVQGCSNGIYFTNNSTGNIDEVDMYENNWGATLYNSDPCFTLCYFVDNLYNGLRMFTSSAPTIGGSNNTYGNRFETNGNDNTFTSENAEMFIHDADPDFADKGNDFVDTNPDNDTYNYVLIEYIPAGIPETFDVSENYFDGDPDNNRDLDDWLVNSIFFTGLGDVANENFRDPFEFDDMDIAASLENSGKYEEAAALYMKIVKNEELVRALKGWIRCQDALETDEHDIIAELDKWIENNRLGSAAFWSRVTFQNRIEDFETSIKQIDDYVHDSETASDSLVGMLGELTTYYQMYLAGCEIDGYQNTSSRKGGTDGDALIKLPQVGQYTSIVPTSSDDYHQKRDDLYLQIQRGVSKALNSNSEHYPTKFELESIYPNPFNPSTMVTFALTERSNVKLIVYDILGQEIAQLVDGQVEAGSHQITWHGTSTAGQPVASGIYFVQLQTKKFTSTKKAVLVK